jgi:ATP-dependent exoDNAse (exonuclease V) beta subunit
LKVNQIKTDLSNLNDKQREAVVSENKRLLVLAGAGSGKTKTLLQKIIYVIEEKGVSPFKHSSHNFYKECSE